VNPGEAGTVTEVNLIPFATGVSEMNKTLRGIRSACGLATLFLASSSAHAFCTEFDVFGVGLNCGDEGHKRVTGVIKPILRGNTWNRIWEGNYDQDAFTGEFANDGKRHFESCRFVTEDIRPGSIDYIRSAYQNAINYLDPANPSPFVAADRFGKLLHTAQDFYSHTNWINLLNLTGSAQVSAADLFDSSLGEWPLLDSLVPFRDDIILGQIPSNGLPAGWSVTQALDSETPIFMNSDGAELRGLITGWNEDGACPDVRPGTTVDENNHVEADIFGQVTIIPRTNRLTHGESKIAGDYDWDLPFLSEAYQANRPCHDGYPTSLCLQKDHPGRPDYGQAIELAKLQTSQEWCRLLHLAKDSEHGYAASSILMALWAKPQSEPSGPHPSTTACGTPPEVFAGKPGPIEVTIDPQAVAVLAPPEPRPGDCPVYECAAQRHLVFALYTGDFRRSIYRTAEAPLGTSSMPVAPITMCVKPADKLVATVWGWADSSGIGTDFDAADRVFRGTTLVLNGPGFQPENEPDTLDLDVDFLVTVGGEDPDGDGLSSACGEVYYGTNPQLADTDNDGLNDGAEVNTYHTDPLDADSDDDGLNDGPEVKTYGTDPLDSDTDDDELTDGAEVNTYGTNPLDADTDDDGLTDGAEVNTHGTDPLDADTDDDGLPDGIEVNYGTDPLDADTDNDGLPDGKDVDWIEDVIEGIPAVAIKSPADGNRNAMLNLLEDAESLLLKGNRKPALDKLTTLRSRIDGCGTVCDSNDWILDCTIQKEIRMLVDLLIANVRA
jgi:hypothetical protein